MRVALFHRASGSGLPKYTNVPIEVIRWFLGHNDIATTRGYILNNQGKEKTKQIVIESLSGMNGIDVLKRTQDLQKEKSPEALISQDS